MSKNNLLILTISLILFLLPTIISCGSLKLFEIPINSEKETETLASKYKSDDIKYQKSTRIINELKKRKRATVGRSLIDEGRLVRRDLQDFIYNEWTDGWEYISKINIKTYASTKNGTDGLLIDENNLSLYDIDLDLFNSKAHITNIQPGEKLSFFHLSDVQLHDERVYMFSKNLTSFFDKFVNSFEHDPDMVFYDYSYYLAVIGAMRILSDRLANEKGIEPSFMIHTGDSVNMGVVSELYELIYITNNLEIPWFNVIGNHDFQVYGNISSKHVGVINPNMGFQTINSRYNFINMHGKGFDLDSRIYFSPDNAPHGNTASDRRSVYNGFDMRGKFTLENEFLNERMNQPCEKCHGYYFFEALEPKDNDPGILCVVLDTTTKNFRFSLGTVYKDVENEDITDKELRKALKYEQINWLKDVLERYSTKNNWMVLVFAHHPLSRGFFDESDEELIKIFEKPKYNVIAYFCGHNHTHEINYHKNSNNANTFGFWEVITGSIFEYPKKGSLVTLRLTEEKRWELMLQSFWPYFIKRSNADIPVLLENAKKCFDASMDDNNERKLKKYKKLDPKHHDVKLEFVFPKN